MALSGLCLVGVTGVVRWLGSELNPIQAAFIRYAFGLLLVIPIFLKMGIIGIRSSRIGLLAGRGAIHGIAVMLWFFAMTRIPVAEVTALSFTSSIFIIIGAILFLKESLHAHRVIAVLAGLNATLTLPGIAGLILTIGMAVDANVIVFERIREELDLGKTVRAAIDSGYERAFITILDANVTTLIAAFVLAWVGSGPIKGFAVTLSTGIVCSMFTAIFVTRTVFMFFSDRKPLKSLSI